MDLGLRGKWALVCGASKGLGWGCARALAQEGVHVVMAARGAEALEAAADALRAETGAQVLTVAADVTTEAGRAALFAEADALMKHEWLVVADLGSRQGQREERIYLAADLDPALFERELAEQVRAVEVLDWDEREGVLRVERQRKVGELLLERQALATLDEDSRCRALVGLVRRKGLQLLPWTSELRQWQARVALLRELDLQQQGHSDWPDLSDAALLASLDQWLTPFLSKVNRLSHFAGLDLPSILQTLLPWPLPQRLDELAPRALSVPSARASPSTITDCPIREAETAKAHRG